MKQIGCFVTLFTRVDKTESSASSSIEMNENECTDSTYVCYRATISATVNGSKGKNLLYLHLE